MYHQLADRDEARCRLAAALRANGADDETVARFGRQVVEGAIDVFVIGDTADDAPVEVPPIVVVSPPGIAVMRGVEISWGIDKAMLPVPQNFGRSRKIGVLHEGRASPG